jgi:hypothetical protein
VSEKKKNHPLIEKILNLVTFDPMYQNMGMPDPKVLYLSDEAKKKIKIEFEQYFDSNELPEIIVALLELVNAFEKEGHNEIAISIIEIIVTANESLQKLNKPNFS